MFTTVNCNVLNVVAYLLPVPDILLQHSLML